MSTQTTTNSYSAFIPEIWSAKLNNMLTKECVMLQCVNRNYEGEIKNGRLAAEMLKEFLRRVNT